jgi:hypothetical protein
MKKMNDIDTTIGIMEQLPWLTSPRLLFEFSSLEEAKKELEGLENLAISGSSFVLAKINKVVSEAEASNEQGARIK